MSVETAIGSVEKLIVGWNGVDRGIIPWDNGHLVSVAATSGRARRKNVLQYLASFLMANRIIVVSRQVLFRAVWGVLFLYFVMTASSRLLFGLVESK